jgi:tRNA modification GTPase
LKLLRRSPDTVAAIATAQGRGGVGIIRVSGDKSAFIASQIIGKIPDPRHAHYASFVDENGLAIDQGIGIFFVAPNSYTGEDIFELQGHGGAAVLQLLLQRCLSLGARLAEPGEFTQRAYLNNKIDLAQAEAVSDLIDATTTQAARSAMRSLNGDFSNTINGLVSDLVKLRMLVEAMLDFPEEDIDSIDVSARDHQLSEINSKIKRTLKAAKQGSLLREGAHIALVGRPNVGKSSLLNRLAGESVALVSSIPGTTRDVIRKEIQINGIPLHIIDTAGLRESNDEIEQMGMELTRQTLQKEDVILLLKDANTCDELDVDQRIIDSLPAKVPRLYVFNKADLLENIGSFTSDKNSILVSANTGFGFDALREKLVALVGWNSLESGLFMARERHLKALHQAANSIEKAQYISAMPELFAEELRLAQASLNEITGRFSADDLLGEIFSRFCIGK